MHKFGTKIYNEHARFGVVIDAIKPCITIPCIDPASTAQHVPLDPIRYTFDGIHASADRNDRIPPLPKVQHGEPVKKNPWYQRFSDAIHGRGRS